MALGLHAGDRLQLGRLWLAGRMCLQVQGQGGRRASRLHTYTSVAVLAMLTKDPPGDDVLNANQAGICLVGVEDDALPAGQQRGADADGSERSGSGKQRARLMLMLLYPCTCQVADCTIRSTSSQLPT